MKFQTTLIEDQVRREIKEHDVVAYKCQKLWPDGSPIQPVIYQIRHDLDWKDILKRQRKLSGIDFVEIVKMWLLNSLS